MLTLSLTIFFVLFFFNDTATTEIYTLSLHDALPIYLAYRDYILLHRNAAEFLQRRYAKANVLTAWPASDELTRPYLDRKSTRLNSSHPSISYAVFCLKKKTSIQIHIFTIKTQFFLF